MNNDPSAIDLVRALLHSRSFAAGQRLSRFIGNRPVNLSIQTSTRALHARPDGRSRRVSSPSLPEPHCGGITVRRWPWTAGEFAGWPTVRLPRHRGTGVGRLAPCIIQFSETDLRRPDGVQVQLVLGQFEQPAALREVTAEVDPQAPAKPSARDSPTPRSIPPKRRNYTGQPRDPARSSSPGLPESGKLDPRTRPPFRDLLSTTFDWASARRPSRRTSGTSPFTKDKNVAHEVAQARSVERLGRLGWRNCEFALKIDPENLSIRKTMAFASRAGKWDDGFAVMCQVMPKPRLAISWHGFSNIRTSRTRPACNCNSRFRPTPPTSPCVSSSWARSSHPANQYSRPEPSDYSRWDRTSPVMS